jgi:4-amino-4-deoxy-L-arabinose transferase-like glycosyltransferase
MDSALVKEAASGGRGMGDRPLADRLAGRLHLSRYSFYVALVMAVFALFHLVKSSFMGLQVDEANWLMQTKHLSAGYFYHPPFIAFQQFAVTRVLGDSLLAVRVGPIAFTAATLLMIYLLFRDMFGDERWAFWLTLVVAILPITNFWLVLGLQDAPFLFFCFLTTWLLWRIVSREQRNLCYLAGITSGLMLLCKLQAVLFFLGIFIFILASSENRRWLKRKELYLSSLIAVAMFLPTFIWYVGRGFEPITYQLRNRPGFLTAGPLEYIAQLILHIAKEMLVLSPFIYLLCIFGLIYGAYLGFSRKGGGDRRFPHGIAVEQDNRPFHADNEIISGLIDIVPFGAEL